jgi:chromosome segregation ATPase
MMNDIRQVRLRSLLLLPLLGLAACEAPTGCDPARAGFVESLSCSNGGFQGRQAALEQDLAASRANALEQKASASRAGAEASAAQRDLAARRHAMTQLDQRLAEMRGRLQSAESRPNVDQAAVQQASAQLNDLARQQSKISHQDPSDADLRIIEERQRKMMQILNDL